MISNNEDLPQTEHNPLEFETSLQWSAICKRAIFWNAPKTFMSVFKHIANFYQKDSRIMKEMLHVSCIEAIKINKTTFVLGLLEILKENPQYAFSWIEIMQIATNQDCVDLMPFLEPMSCAMSKKISLNAIEHGAERVLLWIKNSHPHWMQCIAADPISYTRLLCIYENVCCNKHLDVLHLLHHLGQIQNVTVPNNLFNYLFDKVYTACAGQCDHIEIVNCIQWALANGWTLKLDDILVRLNICASDVCDAKEALQRIYWNWLSEDTKQTLTSNANQLNHFEPI